MKLTTIAKQVLGRQTPNTINEGQVLKGMVDGKPTYIIEHDGQELRVSEKDWKAFKDMISLKESVVNEGTMSDIHMLAQEASTIEDFIKGFMADYGDKFVGASKPKLDKWLADLYADTKS
tara:strand:+ start:3526 stop:3885 length:360 start_codon:yes stop_codon:yes gene_type:complete